MRVWIDPDRLTGLNMTSADVTAAIAAGDPRADNWVYGDREVPSLVHWENAMLGPIEYDLAVIAHELLIAGRQDLLPMVEAPARNKAAFRWSLAIVGVKGLTQVAASSGPEAGEARRQLLSTVLKRF